MRFFRLCLSVGALALVVPMTATAAESSSGTASGAIAPCQGYPQPPFKTLSRGGVTFTVKNTCNVYSGTVSGVARGTQYTAVLTDGSRLLAGQERFEGSIAVRRGIADFRFDGNQPCTSGCPRTISVHAVDGSRGLDGVSLELTLAGQASLTYTGSYSFDREGSDVDRGGDQ
ncbi:MAG TPA: hypothetical protein VFR68_00955 [Candidatus Dormibacteraeota bacterium]|nr:hypothetical protein [Candidatus Dormibacteraeota bacterium]